MIRKKQYFKYKIIQHSLSVYFSAEYTPYSAAKVLPVIKNNLKCLRIIFA